MTKQVISLSDQAANRIKEIMSSAENGSIGVRVGWERSKQTYQAS